MNKKTLIAPSLLFCSLMLLGTQDSAQAMSACECYNAGKSIGQSKVQLTGGMRPQGCRAHSMGPMTPFLGGYYDGYRGNSKYLNDSARGGNGWCSNSGGYGSGGSGNSSSGGGYSSGSGSSGGSYRWLQAAFYAQKYLLATSAGCPPGYDYDKGGCYIPCQAGSTQFHSKYSDLCVSCPPGTDENNIQLDHRGIPFCAQR